MCVICGCPSCQAIVAPQLSDGKLSSVDTLSQGFFLSDAKWGQDAFGTPGGTLTWSVDFTGLNIDPTSGLTEADYLQTLQEAFDAWEYLINVDFQMVTQGQSPDVAISFTDQNVGNYEFGQAGGVLAVASYNLNTGPNDNNLSVASNGYILFDTAETWVLSNPEVTESSFLGVAIHEIGHILGLGHFNVEFDGAKQIMNAFSGPEAIQSGDAAGGQFIYGIKTNTGSTGNDVLAFGDGVVGVLAEGRGGDDTITGTLGGDAVAGGDGNDTLNGRDGDDVLVDTSGTNAISGGADSDIIIGGFGALSATGDAGGDVLIGGIGADTLDGGAGNDVLRGDPTGSFLGGNDTLIAGTGTDYLEGGAGADVFVFAPNDGANGIGELSYNGTSAVMIGQDFEVGVDKIDVSAFGFTDFADLGANLFAYQGAANTQFSADGTSVVILGVAVSELSADDFILV